MEGITRKEQCLTQKQHPKTQTNKWGPQKREMGTYQRKQRKNLCPKALTCCMKPIR